MTRYLTLFIFLFFQTSLLADESSFAGHWQTTYGEMFLTQDGPKIAGPYFLNGVASKIDGVLRGKRFEFTYQEPNAEGKGWFELSSSGREFSGKWRQGGSETWLSWEGRRGEFQGEESDSFDGLWESTFGRMRLIASGESVLQNTGGQVRGIYAEGEGSYLTGSVEGNKLTFTYREPNATGEGWFELLEGGNILNGKWKEKGSSEWQGWTATRIHPRPGIVWLVVLEAPWERHLIQSEYSFGNMLQSFFARTPRVQVRHRFFYNKEDLKNWIREIAYLPEPAVLTIASHGTEEGISVQGKNISPQEIAMSFSHVNNLKLLHFSACLMMRDNLAGEILRKVKKSQAFPISGYEKSADWAGSAVVEFMYFDLILSRDVDPLKAASQLSFLFPFVNKEDLKGSSVPGLGFKILAPSKF